MSIWVASWIFAWLLHTSRHSLLIVVVFHAWFDIVTTSSLGPTALPTLMGVGITLIGLVLLRRLLQLGRDPDLGGSPAVDAGDPPQLTQPG